MMLATALIALAAQAAVATNDEVQTPLELAPITVEAEKYPTEERDIAATVTVIDDTRIDRELARSMEDLVRYEPGIDVPYQGSRFGSSGIVIRGIGGSRVRMEVDGVPLSDAFSIGDFSNASRDFVDVDSLKQVEITRGPSSALFGSNAVGGVVSFVTKDPVDYLAGDPVQVNAKGGYYSSDDSWVGNATVAGESGDWAAMVQGTWRQGHERQDIDADPHDYDSLNVLAKLTHGDLAAGGLRFTVERFEEDSTTDVVSLQGVQNFSASFGFPYIITTESVLADDSRERTRLSLGQESSTGWLGTSFLRWRAYYQESETEQTSVERRSTNISGRISPVERERSFLFEQDLYGAELNLVNEFAWGNTSHVLSYGAEVEIADTNQIRDGIQYDLITGETSSQVGPDDFPVRDFPRSDTTSYGIYLQDKISFGAFSLIPGIRWDRYQLDPELDPIFAEDNPGFEPTDLDESSTSPKLGALWDLNDAWQLWAQYSEGFRAPPVNDANVGFTNFRFGYKTIPNPDLESETSRGYEVGVRYETSTARFNLSYYDTDYEDFIQSLQPVGFDPANGLLIFQSINIDDVSIHGIETQFQWAPAAFPDGLSLRFAASYSEGDNDVTNLPLNAIAPLNGVLGLDYAGHNGRWGASVLARGADKQDRVDDSEGPLYIPDGYVVFDATAWFRPTPGTRIRAGLFNLTDKDYTAWLDVAGLPADVPNPERFQSPGFNVGLQLDLEF